MTQQTDIITDIATMKAQIIEIKGDVEEHKMKIATMTEAYYKVLGGLGFFKGAVIVLGLLSTLFGLANYLK